MAKRCGKESLLHKNSTREEAAAIFRNIVTFEGEKEILDEELMHEDSAEDRYTHHVRHAGAMEIIGCPVKALISPD